MQQAAIYVRVSTNQQKEEETIESQKAVLLTFAKNKGFEVPPKLIFEDDGVSGSTLARPALDKLRDYATDGLFNYVFILSPDRLSRKYAYQALLFEEFRRHGVTLVFHNSPNQNTPEEAMLVQMQGMFAEYERAQITERTRRGKKHKAKNGAISVLSRASYGYRYINDSIERQAYLEINDKEASIIRAIFDLYVKERLSVGKIKEYLEGHKIFSPQGKMTWSRTTISSILSNSAYRGIAYYGKRQKCDLDPMRLPRRQLRIEGGHKPRKSYSKRDRSEWIEIPVPRIVDDEVFELAQELLQKNVQLSLRNTREGSLLQGLISCKECGYSFKKIVSGTKAKGYHYYRCAEPGRKCSNTGIRTQALDEAVWRILISILESPDLIKEEISRRVSELKNEPQQMKTKQLEKKVAGLEMESNRLLDAFQAGHIEMEELTKRMSALKREMNNTKRQVVETNVGLSKEQLLELTEAIRYFSSHLKDTQKNLTLSEKRKILRMLIKEIQISKDGIEIKHIIPIAKTLESDSIAHLRTGRDSHYAQ